MTISQPGIKSITFYCHTGPVLMNAIATQDCTHDPTFRQFSPSVFIRGDLRYVISTLVRVPEIGMTVAICHKKICILLANDVMLTSI